MIIIYQNTEYPILLDSYSTLCQKLLIGIDSPMTNQFKIIFKNTESRTCHSVPFYQIDSF